MHSKVPASIYPVHSGLFPGNQAQLLPGRPLSTVRVSPAGIQVVHTTTLLPKSSAGHAVREPLLSAPGLCISVLAWERNPSPPWRTAHSWSTQSLLALGVCPLITLRRTTRNPTVPSRLGSTLFQGLQSPSFCTDRPWGLRICPTHLISTPPLWALRFVWDRILFFPHPLRSGPSLSPSPLRTFSRFRILRQRPGQGLVTC